MREMPNGAWLAFQGRRQHRCAGLEESPRTTTQPSVRRRWPSWIGTWSARLGYAIGLVFAGAYIVLLAAVLIGMLVGATVGTGLIGRDAALHVLATAEATEPEVLLRNISVGTALAVLLPWLALWLWWRSQPTHSSKRHLAFTSLAGFGLVWAVLFVGGEAFSRTTQPGPNARPAATFRSAPPTAAPKPTTQPAAATRATATPPRSEAQAFVPIATTLVVRTIAPSATATAPPAASSPTPGPIRYGYVSGTGGQGVYLRRTPEWNDRLGAFVEGTRMSVAGETIGDDGTTWVQVTAPDGQQGYVPAQYISDQPPPARTPVATATARQIPQPTSTRATASTTPAPTVAPIAGQASFTIGATTRDVEAVQGTPSSRNASYWTYGLATVEFAADRVVGWSNVGDKLHVTLAGAGTKAGGSFGVGSSRADVAAVQGVPSGYHAAYWNYGLATVEFTGEQVSGWSNIGDKLRVSLPGAGTKQGSSFSVNSSRADVAAVQGVPSGFHAAYWNYGLATVEFTGDRVTGWSNIGGVLRVSLEGAGTRANGTFAVGSSKSDVAAVQGVPTGYHPSYWNYGLATVEFDGDRVKSWSNIGNVLHVN
jgi:hypothetical protein